MNWKPAPFQHKPWELPIYRAGFALVLLFALHSSWPGFASMPKPHGLGVWIDFSFFGQPDRMPPFYHFYQAALALYAAGVLMPLALGYMSFFTIGVGTLMNSQGAIGHSSQFLAMIVLAQFLVHSWFAFRRVCRGQFGLFTEPAASVSALDWARNVFASAYVVSAVVKLVNSNGEWLLRTPNIALQLIKTNEMDYYNRLQNEVGFWATDFPIFLVEHPWFAMLLFGSGLFIELFAFALLFGKRWAFFTGLAVIALHLSISKIMRLYFEEHMGAALVLCVLPLVLSWAGSLFKNSGSERP